MLRWQAIGLAVGGVVVAAFGAFAVAKALSRPPLGKLRGTGATGSPPQPPPTVVQGADGKLYAFDAYGKQVEVDADGGATVNGTHFSPSELGLTLVTGGTYGTTKYYLAHPTELAGDLKNIPDKIGETLGSWGEKLGF